MAVVFEGFFAGGDFWAGDDFFARAGLGVVAAAAGEVFFVFAGDFFAVAGVGFGVLPVLMDFVVAMMDSSVLFPCVFPVRRSPCLVTLSRNSFSRTLSA